MRGGARRGQGRRGEWLLSVRVGEGAGAGPGAGAGRRAERVTQWCAWELWWAVLRGDSEGGGV